VVNTLPWGMNDDITAMNYVWGNGNWTAANYSTPATNIFAPDVEFVMLQGSDMNGNALSDFLNANSAVIFSWINAGGHLFVNAANNDTVQTITLHFEDENATITNFIYSGQAHSLDPAHPIFNGPYLPVALNYTGNYCSHGTISGAGLTGLICGNLQSQIILAYRTIGCGTLMIGTLTEPTWWHPTTEARNLYYNIYKYSGIQVCSAPANLTVSGITYTDANINWSGTGLGYLYVLDQIAAAPAVPDTFTSNFNFNATNLLPGTVYYFHVRSICCADTSGWATVPFTTTAYPACNPPAPFIYSIDTLTIPFSATIAWPANAPEYEWVFDDLQVQPTAAGTVTTDTFADLANIAIHTHQYFHVRSICHPADSSDWAILSLNTPWPLEIGNVNKPDILITCNPNPAKDNIAVNIQGHVSPDATLVLTDISGRSIQKIAVTNRQVNIDISKLVHAVYLLRYKDGETSKVMKVMKE